MRIYINTYIYIYIYTYSDAFGHSVSFQNTNFIYQIWKCQFWANVQMSQNFTCRDLNTLTHASFTSKPSLIHIWAMTHLHLSDDLFTSDPWLIHIWAMTHSRMSHDSLTSEPWRIHSNDSSYKSVMKWATQFLTESVRAWVCVCACMCVCVCVCVCHGLNCLHGSRCHNTETQFVTQMNGVCTETQFCIQMYSSATQYWHTVRDSNQQMPSAPWVMTCRYLSHDSFICMSLGIRHSTFAWSRPHTFV